MVGKKKITTTKIGFCQPGMGWSWPQLRDFWVEGEKLGFDSGTMMDNLIYTGPPNDAVRPTFETWSVLPALAEVTSRIRIGPQVYAQISPSLGYALSRKNLRAGQNSA